MNRPVAKTENLRHAMIGRRVRVRCEGEVLAHFDAGPTAPERVSVRVAGIITIVPVANIEIVR